MDSKQTYVANFKQSQTRGNAAFPAWVGDLRESAIEKFDQLGFPTTRSEEWKYTSVDAVASAPFASANGEGCGVAAADVFSLSFTDFSCNRLVFLNGVLAPKFSSLRELTEGVRVLSLADALERDDRILRPYLSKYSGYEKEAFVALNTAFMKDGAVVFVPEKCQLVEPIYLIFVSIAGEKPVGSHPRNLIVLGAGSDSKIVETHVGLGAGKYFTNAVTELILNPGAVADHYRLQRETDNGTHVGTLAAELTHDSHLTASAITLGGALVRNDVHVMLNGEGADCTLNGLYLLENNQHVDNHTEIEHLQPRCSSRELYKGILNGQAHGVFNGKIIVHKDAQKTDARQTNKNLLLSRDAVVNTKPQLEIYADDVKCSHGSTIGQLDDDALFYLRSRGIGSAEAQSLLSYAFASDVVNRVKIARMRARLDDYLLTKFGRN